VSDNKERTPNFSTMWIHTPCDHDFKRREGAAVFDCSKCQAVKHAHMLEEVDGKWVEKKIPVQPWKPRRR
jgi:hypothetical protein